MKDLEISEVFLDAKRKEIFTQIEKDLPKKPEKIFLFFIFLSFLILAGRLFHLSVLSNLYFSERAIKNQYLLKEFQTERGVIFDRNLEQLVFNEIRFDLWLDREKLEDEEKLKEVEKFLGIEGLKEKIKEDGRNEILLFQNLNQKQVLQVEGNKEKFPFLKIKKVETRFYKDGPVFSHILGYTRREGEKILGVSGIEGFYNEILSPTPAKIKIERNAKGEIIKEEVERLPEPGKNLVLTIDASLQRKFYQVMEAKIRETGAKGGAGIILNPKNGEILALVSFPSFDNNIFSKGDEKEIEKILKGDSLFNRAISGEYLVGSTIKPLLALSALEEKKISEKETIDCKGKMEMPHSYQKEKVFVFEDWTIHGPTSLKKAIAESCNVYFYKLGLLLGPTKIKEYLKIFGWGEKTGIDLLGEKEGFLPDPKWKKETLKENWWDGDTLLYAIGQQYLKITPIQVVSAFQAIANNGKIFQPHFLKKVLDKNKNVVEEKKEKILKNLELKEEHFEIVKEGMRRAVTGVGAPHASARLLSDFPFSVAAKTGTAEVQKGVYQVWVTAFAPVEDPQILLTIVIEKVPYLSVVTLPVAKEVLNFYFQHVKENSIK